jgi:hypothetical protein
MDDIDALKNILCKGEFSSLTFSYNDHACNYVSVKKWFEEYEPDELEDFISEDEMKKAIETNSVWSAQWYPNTPVGFCVARASTFDALIKYLTKEPNK